MTVSEPVDPGRLAEAVLEGLGQSSAAVSAFWYRVHGNRQEYAEELREAVRPQPVVVIPVREVRFDNPNAILDDLVDLVERNQEICATALRDSERHGKCALVLLSRSELAVAQLSSPVTLPPWFPIVGGSEVSCRIADLTWVAAAALNSPEASISAIAEHLYALESALIDRLSAVFDRDKHLSDGLLEKIRSENESFAELLESARSFLATVAARSSFRPSVRDGQTLVGRLVRAVQGSKPDVLGRLASALARSLALPADIARAHESLATVLGRPSNRSTDEAQRFALNLVLTLRSACQFATAAAHADDYSQYPVTLLRSVAYDFRRALTDLSEALAGLA